MKRVKALPIFVDNFAVQEYSKTDEEPQKESLGAYAKRH